MKLARLQIENFRHLGSREKPFELDFTDALGRVRDFSLLVGPNASGKTTVLDAIALALGRTVGMAALRRDFKVSPRTVVRHGQLNAKVTCWLRFTLEEIRSTREIFGLAGITEKVPDAQEVVLTWTYPAPKQLSEFNVSTANVTFSAPTTNAWVSLPNAARLQGASTYYTLIPATGSLPQDYGIIDSKPEAGWVLLHGRDQAARLLATGRADWGLLENVGGVFTFDQERTSFGKTISRQFWNIIHGTEEAAKENEQLRTTDPRTILIDLALQSLVPPIASREQRPEEFQLVQETYARICAPRQIVGAVRDELGEFDIRFYDGENDYTYEGLSSGEKNVLQLLIGFVGERIHQSVVLIDELELHQHPVWQRKLVHMVPQMGKGNQIIATTHSPYLRGAVEPDAVRDLGGLGHVHQGAD
jgi:predicted ATPase